MLWRFVALGGVVLAALTFSPSNRLSSALATIGSC